jgi:hypothetical protein
MTIRGRAFALLSWLVLLTVSGVTAAAYAYRESARLNAQQERQAEVLTLQAAAWRALMEAQADHRGFRLTGSPALRDRRDRDRRVYTTSLTRLSAFVDSPAQQQRLAAIHDAVDAWSAAWNNTQRAAPAGVAEAEIIIRDAEQRFEPVLQALVAFETESRRDMEQAVARDNARLATFSGAVIAIGAIAVLSMIGLLIGTTRALLAPLSEVTTLADRIGRGDFGAARQTLRKDEIGVLLNSFAAMAQAIQSRERALASALAESREFATAAAEARRRVEAAHADLLATVETVPAALMIFNPDGSVRLQNQVATEVFGVEPRSPGLRRAYWNKFRRVAPDKSIIPEDRWLSRRALRGERVANEELEIHRPDGRVFPILASGAPLTNDEGRITGAVVAFQDISRLREVDRLKDEFVSMVSHELRTPLTSVRGSVQLVLDDPAAVGTEQHRQLLQVALGNSERLIRIINDMLDIAKIESGSLTLNRRPCQVADLVRQSVQVVETPARSARVSIAIDLAPALPPVMADADRIVQALVNLLSNAVKFGPPDTAVTVTAVESDGQVAISVADCGEGIAPEDLPRLFQKFQQLDRSSSRRGGGTGLGLVITRTLVELHGGRVAVASEVGRGTTFTVTLPAAH